MLHVTPDTRYYYLQFRCRLRPALPRTSPIQLQTPRHLNVLGASNMYHLRALCLLDVELPSAQTPC